jgi:Ca2+-binding RTX toxin-like protein
VAPDGSSPRRIADEGAPLAWAGDSKRLLFRRGSSIYVREVDGAVEHRVGEGEDASWSPDGSIAIVRRGNTYLVGADGSGERLLTAGRVVQWLPSGEDVLVQDPSGAVRLVSLGTGRSRRIAEDAQAASLRPQLDRLATVLVVGRRSEVYLSDPQGAGPTRITPSQCDQYTSRCVNGTDAADRIQGTPERDVIFPGAGDDRVWGRGGDDRIDTAYGRDFVDAGADNDIVVTHGNDDRLYGGPGIDLLRPSDGEDSVDGGPGRDTVFSDGDGRVDRVRCGPGNDVVFADPIDKIARDCERVRRPPD